MAYADTLRALNDAAHRAFSEARKAQRPSDELATLRALAARSDALVDALPGAAA